MSDTNSPPAIAAITWEAVYEELKRLAAIHLAAERPEHTLQATALVNEAYLRLAGPAREGRFETPAHFFGTAARAMRQILIENARRKQADKRGGQRQRVPLPDVANLTHSDPLDELALDEAMAKLRSEDELAAQIVDLHYLCGLGHAETAESLGISLYQARQKWTYARAFLRAELGRGQN